MLSLFSYQNQEDVPQGNPVIPVGVRNEQRGRKGLKWNGKSQMDLQKVKRWHYQKKQGQGAQEKDRCELDERFVSEARPPTSQTRAPRVIN